MHAVTDVLPIELPELAGHVWHVPLIAKKLALHTHAETLLAPRTEWVVVLSGHDVHTVVAAEVLYVSASQTTQELLES